MRGVVSVLLLLPAFAVGATPASAWVVRFFKLGRTLSSWRFAVRSEDA